MKKESKLGIFLRCLSKFSIGIIIVLILLLVPYCIVQIGINIIYSHFTQAIVYSIIVLLLLQIRKGVA